MKKCTKCGIEKSKEKFYKNNNYNDGLSYFCKSCKSEIDLSRARSKVGLIKKMYDGQVRSSKKRGHKLPEYTKKELISWVLSQPNYNKLFNDWKNSNFNKWLKPSCDRTNDYLGYSLERLELKTWKENSEKANIDRKSGRNRKSSRKIKQYTKDNVFVRDYFSTMQVERELGIYHNSISKCCDGRAETAGGFIWVSA